LLFNTAKIVISLTIPNFYLLKNHSKAGANIQPQNRKQTNVAVKNSVSVFGIIAKHAVNADKQIIIANTLRLFFIVLFYWFV
jgi:hypothetical protein